MKNCKICGKEIAEGVNFCPYCGTLLEAIITKEAEKDACKNYEDEEGKQTEISTESLIKRKSKLIKFIKKSKKIIVISGVVLVTIIVAICVVCGSNCDYSGCKNSVVKGYDYCYNHKCNLCDSSKFFASNYCYAHYLIYDKEAGSSSSNATRDLKFSNVDIDHNSSYTVVTGKVTNNGSRTYKFVEIKGSFETSTGSVVDTDWTYAVGSEGLAPGESTTFRMSVGKDYSITKCDISILDYD